MVSVSVKKGEITICFSCCWCFFLVYPSAHSSWMALYLWKYLNIIMTLIHRVFTYAKLMSMNRFYICHKTNRPVAGEQENSLPGTVLCDLHKYSTLQKAIRLHIWLYQHYFGAVFYLTNAHVPLSTHIKDLKTMRLDEVNLRSSPLKPEILQVGDF